MTRLLRRLAYWARRRRLESELAEEIEFHRARAQASFLRDGLSAAEAAAASRRALGNDTLAREDARRVWVWPWLESLVQDVRYAVRTLRREPGFSAAAIVVVSIGISSATCAFGLLDSLVVKSLPVHRPDRLVFFKSPAFSYPLFLEVQARLPIFSGFFAWNIDRAYVEWSVEPEATDILETTAEYFSTLRVTAAVGRTFDAIETTERDGAAARVAVLSYAAWRNRFGGDPSAVGRAVRVNRVPFTIIGVAPRGFFGVAPGLEPELTVPLASRPRDLETPTSAWLHFMGRLKDGMTIEQGNGVLQAVWPAAIEATLGPGEPADRRARYLARRTGLESARTGFSRVRNQFGDSLRLLMGLATLLLLVACASLTNLLLARGVARGKEIAVRVAIGASHGRVVRQLLTEALVLTSVGALVGLMLASWAGRALVLFLSTTRDRLTLDTGLAWRTVAFTVVLAAIVAMMSAALPAFRASRARPGPAMKETGQSAAALLRRWSAGKVLVSLQVALAVLLLGGATLFGRSLVRLLAQDAGVDRHRVLVVAADAVAGGYRGASTTEYYARLLERLRAVPGVDAAALSWMPPMSSSLGYWTPNIAVDGVGLAPNDSTYVYFNGVSPHYFETVGTTLRRGRDMSDRDISSSPRVVVVNESLARRFFSGRDPLGHRISIGRHPSRQHLEIVGVVEDAKYATLQEPTRSIAYLPCAQLAEAIEGRNLVADVRAATSVAAVAASIRQELQRIDSRVAVRIESVADRIHESTINERVMAILAGSLGVAALLLACAGLYGLLGYAVSRHTREIGLRLALGARPSAVLWMVQRESFVLAAIGIAAGLASALALGRFVRTLLFQISPNDPLSLGAAGGLMLCVAAAAAFMPARRAAHIDPLVALRYE